MEIELDLMVGTFISKQVDAMLPDDSNLTLPKLDYLSNHSPYSYPESENLILCKHVC